MKRIIQVTLSGYPDKFSLSEGADAALQSYLDRAKRRLANDPDRDEVLRDLEQAIAEKLGKLPGSQERVVGRDELSPVLEAIGAVDTDNPQTIPADAPPDHRRKLYRIRQGRWLAGICQGLAGYSGIRVRWVRSIVVVLSLVTVFLALVLMMSNFVLAFIIAWLPILIYIAATFALPVAETRGPCADDYGKHSNAA